MGWFAFALALAALLYFWWRVWRGWIAPCRELEEMVRDLNEERTPPALFLSEVTPRCAGSHSRSSSSPSVRERYARVFRK